MNSVAVPRVVFSLACILVTSVAAIADEAPVWLQQAASIKPPAYEKNVDAVVLLNEENISLDAGGCLVKTERYAVRILNREGRRQASAGAFYLAKFSQISDMQAWLIGPTGTVRSYGKKDIIDRISDPDDIYDEGRIKIIDAGNDSDVGYVFGYSITTEDRPLFYQDQYTFQDNLPTLVSRYSLTLPDGWKASSITFNRATVNPAIDRNTYTWELRDLPPVAKEPMSPSFRNLAPRIAVNYSPADGNQGVNKVFANWLDVSRWASAMHDPQVIVDDTVAAKARDLTAGAKTELEKIRAIGTYVQNIQYISIDIGVGYGNGMKPRTSTMVLGRGYGDCKDKANLMRAMLRALNIDSYPIAIYSGDPDFVRGEWASPGQFNHCIIAIKVSDATNSPTVINNPKLGRLMIFDATDPFTPIGDLPDYLQGSNALLIAGENGGLVQMPVTPPDFNSWIRETDVSLDAAGGISGVIREHISGQEARTARTMFRSLGATDFNKAIEYWLTRGASAAKLIKISPQDKQAESAFNLDVEFAAPAYGQLMQDRLLVFKPAIASRTNSIYLTEKDRKHPVVLESNSFNENVRIKIPAGFSVDEMPEPVNIETKFGRYATSYESKEDKILFSRSLTLNRSTIAPEAYAEVRAFFTKMRDAEQAPVVLIRK